MDRFKFRAKYERNLDMSIPSITNRQKFSSTQKYYNAMNKAKSYVTNKTNMDKYMASDSFGAWRTYYNIRKHNTALLFSTLWKILVIFSPFIIISIIMSTNDFKFDFFVFVKRFQNLQFSLSDDLITFIRNLGSWRYNNFEFVDANNVLDVLRNIGVAIGSAGVLLFELISCIGFIITFIVDFFSNVFAFVGALIPSLSL